MNSRVGGGARRDVDVSSVHAAETARNDVAGAAQQYTCSNLAQHDGGDQDEDGLQLLGLGLDGLRLHHLQDPFGAA